MKKVNCQRDIEPESIFLLHQLEGSKHFRNHNGHIRSSLNSCSFIVLFFPVCNFVVAEVCCFFVRYATRSRIIKFLEFQCAKRQAEVSALIAAFMETFLDEVIPFVQNVR